MARVNPPIFEALSRLRTSWPKRGWSWDSRFETVASTFGTDLLTEAKTSAAMALPHVWTDKTLGTAPTALRDLAKKTGGVRAAQMLLSGDPHGILLPYGLWWPWEDGRTISLRIGIEGASSDQRMLLCSTFGVEP